MTSATASLPSKFHPYLLGNPSCISAPTELLTSLTARQSILQLDPKISVSHVSDQKRWEVRMHPRRESSNKGFPFYGLSLTKEDENLHLYELSLAKKVDKFIREKNLSHLFVVPPKFLYQRDATTYLVSETISSSSKPLSREQVLALTEITTLGLPIAENLSLDQEGRVVLINCESHSRETENHVSRVPTKVLVYSVRLQEALSQTANLKSLYPDYRREIEQIEKKHILKRTAQIITQIAFSLFVVYSIERYLNPHLSAKNLLSKMFSLSFEPISIKIPSFSGVVALVREWIQNDMTNRALSYPFTIKRLPPLTNLVTRFALPLFVSFLLGRYVTKRPLTTSLLLIGVQHIFSPLFFTLGSMKALAVFAETMSSFRT